MNLNLVYETPLPWIVKRESSHAPLTDGTNAEVGQFFRRMVTRSAWKRLSACKQKSRQLDGPALLSDLKGLHEGETSFDLSPLQSPTVYAYGDGIPHHYFAALCVEISNINSNIACRELDNAPHEAHLTSPDELGVLIEEKWRSVCASRSQGQLDSSVQPYCRRCAPVVIL